MTAHVPRPAATGGATGGAGAGRAATGGGRGIVVVTGGATGGGATVVVGAGAVVVVAGTETRVDAAGVVATAVAATREWAAARCPPLANAAMSSTAGRTKGSTRLTPRSSTCHSMLAGQRTTGAYAAFAKKWRACATFSPVLRKPRPARHWQGNSALGAVHKENNHVKRSMKLGVALVATLALFAGFATTANAHSPGVSVFQGTAAVSPNLSFPDEIPVLGGPADPPAGTFVITVPSNTSDICLAVGAGALGVGCGFAVDGVLGGVAGIGPACGMSSGDSEGEAGDVFFTTGPGGDSHAVDLGWVATAGSIIPITGQHSGKTGPAPSLVALVSARAGANPVETVTQCLAGTAATFSVTGVAALL
jgi:hypothetical protein